MEFSGLGLCIGLECVGYGLGLEALSLESKSSQYWQTERWIAGWI